MAPRALNEPVTWKSSSLQTASAVTGNGARVAIAAMTGVTRVKGAIRARAARMSSREIMAGILPSQRRRDNGAAIARLDPSKLPMGEDDAIAGVVHDFGYLARTPDGVD